MPLIVPPLAGSLDEERRCGALPLGRADTLFSLCTRTLLFIIQRCVELLFKTDLKQVCGRPRRGLVKK